MQVLVKIDTRESALFQQLLTLKTSVPTFHGLQFKTEQLPIGDVIVQQDGIDRLVIERKSIADLMSSIKDGRYEEQSYRLNGLPHPNHNIIYLLEGEITSKPNRYTKEPTSASTINQMAYSALFSLNYYKGFSVFRSFHLLETALLICTMAYKLAKEKKPGFYDERTDAEPTLEPSNELAEGEEVVPVASESAVPSEKDYVSVVKKVKKDNITTANIGEIMLCQIPSINAVTALAIMERFQSLPKLIHALETDERCLEDIQYTNAKGQTRKISRTSTTNLVKYLLQK